MLQMLTLNFIQKMINEKLRKKNEKGKNKL